MEISTVECSENMTQINPKNLGGVLLFTHFSNIIDVPTYIIVAARVVKLSTQLNQFCCNHHHN